jgi:hypothetical protein
LKVARIKLRKEECASGTEQRSNDAALKDVLTNLRKEDCASSMEQRSIYAAVREARIMLSKEECALGMEQRSNGAALKVCSEERSVQEAWCKERIRHGAKVVRKLCSSEGRANLDQIGGVCKRHVLR